jgi:hypothetical protein
MFSRRNEMQIHLRRVMWHMKAQETSRRLAAPPNAVNHSQLLYYAKGFNSLRLATPPYFQWGIGGVTKCCCCIRL